MIDEEGCTKGISFQTLMGFERDDETRTLVNLVTSPVHMFLDSINLVRSCLREERLIPNFMFSLGVQVQNCYFHDAHYGFRLPIDWCEKLSFLGRKEKSVQQVSTVISGYSVSKKLRNGDIICKIDDQVIDSTFNIELFVNKLGNKPLNIKVYRFGDELNYEINPTPLSVRGTTRILTFAGIQVQPTHESAKFHGYVPDSLWTQEGVYISFIKLGSPADSTDIAPVRWIVEVNNHPVNNIDNLLTEILKLKHQEYVRVRTMDWQGSEALSTLRLDLHFWPTTELVYDLGSHSWNFKVLQDYQFSL